MENLFEINNFLNRLKDINIPINYCEYILPKEFKKAQNIRSVKKTNDYRLSYCCNEEDVGFLNLSGNNPIIEKLLIMIPEEVLIESFLPDIALFNHEFRIDLTKINNPICCMEISDEPIKYIRSGSSWTFKWEKVRPKISDFLDEKKFYESSDLPF